MAIDRKVSSSRGMAADVKYDPHSHQSERASGRSRLLVDLESFSTDRHDQDSYDSGCSETSSDVGRGYIKDQSDTSSGVTDLRKSPVSLSDLSDEEIASNSSSGTGNSYEDFDDVFSDQDFDDVFSDVQYLEGDGFSSYPSLTPTLARSESLDSISSIDSILSSEYQDSDLDCLVPPDQFLEISDQDSDLDHLVPPDQFLEISDQDYPKATIAADRGKVFEQLRLSAFEEGAMFQTLGIPVSEFFLEQRGKDLADFTNKLGRISRDFLECREVFLNGNSGAWRDKDANIDAVNKIHGLYISCRKLWTKFLAMKGTLESYTDQASSLCTTEDIRASLIHLKQDVNELYWSNRKRMFAASTFSHQDAPQYEAEYTYSQLTIARDNRIEQRYLSPSRLNALTEIDDILIEAEEAQKKRDIYTEREHAIRAYYRLQDVIGSFEKSPKYRMHSVGRKFMRMKSQSEVQRLVDRLKSRASLLETRVKELDESIPVLKGVSLWLHHPDLLDEVCNLVGQYEDELAFCEEMKSQGLLSLDLTELNGRVGGLVAELQTDLKVLNRASEVLAESRCVIKNTSMLDTSAAAEGLEADCEQLRAALRECIPIEAVMTAAGTIVNEIGKHINEFNELGLPSSPEALREVLTKPLDESLYLAFERLRLVRRFCDKRNVENAHLERIFRILDYPEVQSAIQGVRCRDIKALWTAIASKATKEPIVKGLVAAAKAGEVRHILRQGLSGAQADRKKFAMTTNEEKSVRSCLARLEKEIRTNDKKGQQKSLNYLHDVLVELDSRIKIGDCDPALKENKAHLWLELERMNDSIMSSIVHDIPSGERLLDNCITGCEDFIANWKDFETRLIHHFEGTDKGEILNRLKEGYMTKAMQDLLKRFGEEGPWSYKEASESMLRHRAMLDGVEELLASDAVRYAPNFSPSDNRILLSEFKSLFDRIESDLLLKVLRDELSAGSSTPSRTH